MVHPPQLNCLQDLQGLSYITIFMLSIDNLLHLGTLGVE